MKIRCLRKLLKRVQEGGILCFQMPLRRSGWGQLMSLHKTGSQIIPADATSVADLEILVDKAVEALGGKIDFVLHSIGMSVNVREVITLAKITIILRGKNYLRFLHGDAGIV
jgi:enoyl-[acyl-carrier-protein] reductase (NADH)